MTIDIHDGDRLRIALTVLDADGAAQDLTGATVAARARRRAGVPVDPTVTVTDAAAGRAELLFAAGALTQGVWTYQVRVTIDGAPETVIDEDITVHESLFA